MPTFPRHPAGLRELLQSPALFDEALYQHLEALIDALRAEPLDPLVAARRVHAEFTLNDIPAMTRAMQVAEQHPGELTSGVLAMADTLDPATRERIQHYKLLPGIAPLQLENQLHLAAALSIRYTEGGRLDEAVPHLYHALALAHSLEMRNRAQNLTVELSRVSMLRGAPDPTTLMTELASPMPARRRLWSQRVLAESHMVRGSYDQALVALGTPDGDDAKGRALRAFLHVLLGLPAVEGLDMTLPYARLAEAYRRLGGDEDVFEVGQVVDEPAAGYAALHEAATMLRSPTLKQQGMRFLARLSPRLADQKLMRSMLMIHAVSEGAMLHTGLIDREDRVLCSGVLAACEELATPHFVLDFFRRNMPELYVMTALGTSDQLKRYFALGHVPMITGQFVTLEGEKRALPGRAGRIHVLQQLNATPLGLAREEVRRMNRVLRRYSIRPVNLGTVARGCLRMSALMRQLAEANRAARWRQGYDEAVSMMSPCTQDDLREEERRREQAKQQPDRGYP